MAKVVVADVQKCLSCKSCEIACAVAHSQSKVLETAIKESPCPQNRVTVDAVGTNGVPMQCRHCEDAPCMAICPTGAIYRQHAHSAVLIAQEKCIGCTACLAVCPFGLIDISNDGKTAVKCDLCFNRTQAGQLPACVESCPTGALRFEEITETVAKRRLAAAAQTWSSAVH